MVAHCEVASHRSVRLCDVQRHLVLQTPRAGVLAVPVAFLSEAGVRLVWTWVVHVLVLLVFALAFALFLMIFCLAHSVTIVKPSTLDFKRMAELYLYIIL